MADPAPVEAVIFDWGGTLAAWSLVEFEDVWRMAAHHLAPHLGEPADQLEQRLAAIEVEAWTTTAADHRAFTFRDLVGRASAALSVDLAGALIEQASRHYLDAWVPHIAHDPEAAPLLRQLRRRGLRTALLSNTHWPSEFHERMLERDGLAHLLDARLYTSELAYMKPHPMAFKRALEALEVEASRAVFVGDRLRDDIFGAQRAGMRTIHRPNPHVPHYDVTPDATIERLAEIPGILDRWDATNGGG